MISVSYSCTITKVLFCLLPVVVEDVELLKEGSSRVTFGSMEFSNYLQYLIRIYSTFIIIHK